VQILSGLVQSRNITFHPATSWLGDA
jgi:hypothetical protein